MKEKMKSFNKENIVLISQNIKNMKSGTNPEHFLEDSVTLLWKPVPPFVHLPIPRFLSHPYFKMLGCRSRADVATWRRRDMEVSSMFYSSLLQKLLSPLLFSLYRTCIQNKHQMRNLNTKNYIINIKSKWK